MPVTLPDIDAATIAIYGPRGGANTGATGWTSLGEGWLLLFQQGGGSDRDTALAALAHNLRRNNVHNVYDARSLLGTKRKLGETTGFHAEAVLVWAMLTLWGGGNLNRAALQGFFSMPGRSAVIAANADCCLHCHRLLTYLGIQHPVPADGGRVSLTGWWDPLEGAGSRVTPNAEFSAAFNNRYL